MNITKNGVLMLATAEASMLGHTYVGTEHLLLSVCSLTDTTGKLRTLILKEVKNYIGCGTPTVLYDSDKYLTQRAKRVLTDSSTVEELLLTLKYDSGSTASIIIKNIKEKR